MTYGALLVSTAVMGLALVGAAFATTRLLKRPTYTPAFRPMEHGGLLDGEGSTLESTLLPLGIAALLVLFAGGVLLGDSAIVLGGALALLIAGYFTWGVYNIARVRGLPRAHSVGLSAWVFGVVLVSAIAVKLLLG